jgi:hypothetical protein
MVNSNGVMVDIIKDNGKKMNLMGKEFSNLIINWRKILLKYRFNGIYKNGKKNGYGILKFPNGS